MLHYKGSKYSERKPNWRQATHADLYFFFPEDQFDILVSGCVCTYLLSMMQRDLTLVTSV